MIRKIAQICGLSLCCLLSGWSQNNQQIVYSLNDCINIALENNLELKQTTNRADGSKIRFKQSRNELYPNLNMNYVLGVNNGRSIDPYSNDIINEQLTFSSLGLNLDVTIFNGLRIQNSIKQSKFNLKASEMEVEEAKQDLILEVTFRYLQILNSKDEVELAKARLEKTQGQLDRLEIQYNQGYGNPAEYPDMKGQFALDQIAMVNARNALDEAKINLIRLLSTDADSNIEFEHLEGLVETQQYALTSDQVFNASLENLAIFKAKQLRIDAADSGVKLAKSNYFPVLSIFGQLNTNYSGLAQSYTETGTTIGETGDFIDISNQIYPVLNNQTLFQSENINYLDQLDNNLSSVVGISVRIPLFNGFNAKNTVALEKIQLKERSLDLQNTIIMYKQSIKDAYIKMESAFDRHHILIDQVEAYQASFNVNEIRFNNGVSNSVEYLTSKNNLDAAKLNLANSKYEYILRVRVLDYYRGLYKLPLFGQEPVSLKDDAEFNGDYNSSKFTVNIP